MGWWTDPGSQAGPPHSRSNTVGRRLASPKGGQEDVKEQVEKKRREKRKEMQKAGSHEVRNERSVSNAQHQCWEVANTRILSSYLKELIECLLAYLELLQEVADSFFKPVFFTMDSTWLSCSTSDRIVLSRG